MGLFSFSEQSFGMDVKHRRRKRIALSFHHFIDEIFLKFQDVTA